MKLGDLIPKLSVKYLAVEQRYRDGTRTSGARICRDNHRDLNRLFRLREWEVENIEAGVRQIDGVLWPLVVLTVTQPEKTKKRGE